MPAKELPTFSNLDRYADTLRAEGASAYGVGGGELTVPDNDAAKIPSGLKDAKITSSHNEHAPLEAISIATTSEDAPQLGAFLKTNLHETNWLDPTKPHVSPERQSGKPPSQHGR